MFTLSQALTFVGLIFELLSVYLSVRGLLKTYYERLMKGTLRQEIKKQKRQAYRILNLFIVGMIFQLVAVLIS